MNKYLLLLLGMFLLPVTVWGQVDSTRVDSSGTTSTHVDSLLLSVEPVPIGSLTVSVQDSAGATATDTLAADTTKKLYTLRPWVYHRPLNAHMVASDSTLRWNIWPSWTYRKNRDPGVISFRMGSMGRSNTFSVYAHTPTYMELYWGDIRMNDPVTGIINWNGIPLHKISRIYEEDTGMTYKTTFYLKEFHLLKPLTKLIYSESKFDYRNLEFMLSRNFGRKTNAEISYWYRAGGGEYNNSSVSGNQIYARLSHQLSQTQKLKFTLLNNSYTSNQPFGYLIENMGYFPFNRFSASPSESGASSDRSSTIISLDYYQRPADSTRLVDDLHAGLFMRSVKRKLTYSADTTFYKVRQLGANVEKWVHLGPLLLSGAASFQYFMNADTASSSVKYGNWSVLEAEGELIFEPLSFFDLSVQAGYRKRGANHQYKMGAEAALNIFGRITLTAGYSTGIQMPTIQQLYWESNEFMGNQALENETIDEMHVKLTTGPSEKMTIGVRGQLKKVDNGIMLVDSTFANVNPYHSLSATAWFDYEGSLFEFYGSATYKKFESPQAGSVQPEVLSSQPRIWFKAGAYIKGYLFNRATYVKAGFRGMFSPQPYRAAHYFPSLDYWQPKSDDSFIPAFHRLDFDLSARVRSIMVTLRVENVLDNVFQLGYFETANYPMNQRRLIFGIKVFFRN